LLQVGFGRSDYFRFGSVFIKKNNQTEILKKKLKTGSNRPVSVRFGLFFGQKPVQIDLAQFFQFGSVFLFWLGFFRFFSCLGSVRFGFFGFRLIKPKHNRTGRFFQNFNLFNQFFSLFGFFGYCFFDFLGLIGFLVFFIHP